MENKETRNTLKTVSEFKDKFEPPKLPFAWMAATFVAPTLVVILPSFFKDDVSLEIRIIIALILMVVLLFISCISITYQLYSEAYARQVLRCEVELTVRQMENSKATIDSHMKTIEQRYGENDKRLQAIEQVHENIDKKLQVLENNKNEQA